MAIFFIMSGAIFWLFTLDGGSGSFQSFFLMQMFTFIVIIPILTMKLFSEEKKMKTDTAFSEKVKAIKTNINSKR